MSKTTTSLFELIQSELIISGKNEFINKGKLTFFDDKYAFIKKIIDYDKDVQEIVDKQIFRGYKISDSLNGDLLFKKTFVNRFMNREIARQTKEDFSSQVIQTSLVLDKYLSLIYGDLDKYIKNTNTSRGSSGKNGITDNRSADAELPQTEVNIDVDKTVLYYADKNNIARSKYKDDENNENTSNSFDLDSVIKTLDMYELVFIEFDKKCFLQIW